MKQIRPARPVPFHRKGMAYFWILNDRCEWAEYDRQLRIFADAGDLSTLCLHPGPGIPFGGGEWFDLIRRICRRAAELDLRIWLYDEDPCPSGNAAGRITAEHPGLVAHGIHRHVYDPNAQGDIAVFGFPTGPLIWCGFVNEKTGATQDLTARVGLIRRKWEITERWDSRYFYPETPLYAQPMAGVVSPEFALTVPPIPHGMRLMAFVAGAPEQNAWSPFGPLADSLSIETTRQLIGTLYEGYRRAVGDLFGTTVEAIFTDEPKFFDSHPWTPGLFEDFKRDRGYDLRPHLHWLFSEDAGERACLARLHYRDYVAERFRRNWMQPIARWCHAHRLKFVGHISPEDDLVEQAYVLGNLMPLQKELDLCGTDVIIPAAGDSRHPILNIGTISAVSIAQQQRKDGAMSETGYMMDRLTMEGIGRVFLWQSVLGLTAPLGSYAGLSWRGPRGNGGPSIFSVDHPHWPEVANLRRQLVEIQNHTHGARQIAPVAILWPIRSFNAQKMKCPDPGNPIRRDFIALVAACLDRQVGTHIIDEADVWDLKPKGGAATLGLARYTHVVIPSCTVLHARTIAKLHQLRRRGIEIIMAGQPPKWQQEPKALASADLKGFTRATATRAVAALPRLLDLRDESRDIRCTAWETKEGHTIRLLMNLRDKPYLARWKGDRHQLEPGQVLAL